MLIVGITGGLCSGKSEVSRRFRELGVPVIDADAVGHRVIAPGGSAEHAVREAFGPQILSDGIIDRQKLGRLVFADAVARQKLNTLVHPRIGDAIVADCATLAEDGHRLVVVEAALWGEDGTLPPWMDDLILVDCPEATRIARAMHSRGMTREEAQRRIEAQVPPERKRAIATYVLGNAADIPSLEAAVDRLAEVLYARSERA